MRSLNSRDRSRPTLLKYWQGPHTRSFARMGWAQMKKFMLFLLLFAYGSSVAKTQDSCPIVPCLPTTPPPPPSLDGTPWVWDPTTCSWKPGPTPKPCAPTTPAPPAPAGYTYTWDISSCSWQLNQLPCEEGVPPGPPDPGYDWVFDTSACQWYQVPTGGGGAEPCLSGGRDGGDCPPEPIVIDIKNEGFHFTSAKNGVLFDFYGTGHAMQLAWPTENSGNAWLVLDRNHNGKIDSAKEMFSNTAAQPQIPGSRPNGFLALAVFDTRQYGGNGDGVIDARDKIWTQLMVWTDINHDGVSQPGELKHLDDVGIHSISLKYKTSKRVDEHGNAFYFRGHLNPIKPDEVDKAIFDVFLTTQ